MFGCVVRSEGTSDQPTESASAASAPHTRARENGNALDGLRHSPLPRQNAPATGSECLARSQQHLQRYLASVVARTWSLLVARPPPFASISHPPTYAFLLLLLFVCVIEMDNLASHASVSSREEQLRQFLQAKYGRSGKPHTVTQQRMYVAIAIAIAIAISIVLL